MPQEYGTVRVGCREEQHGKMKISGSGKEKKLWKEKQSPLENEDEFRAKS